MSNVVVYTCEDCGLREEDPCMACQGHQLCNPECPRCGGSWGEPHYEGAREDAAPELDNWVKAVTGIDVKARDRLIRGLRGRE